MASSKTWEARLAQGLCGHCGNEQPVSGKKECLKCADKRRARQKKDYLANPRTERHSINRKQWKSLGLCNSCGNTQPVIGKLSCQKCLDRTNAHRNKNTQKIKDICYQMYGGYTCICCGETEKQFLTLDHIHNNGNVHRKTMKTSHTYAWIIKNEFPDIFQVLCFNCNVGKHRNGGICPHQVVRVIAEA